jgi:hypothetical protein
MKNKTLLQDTKKGWILISLIFQISHLFFFVDGKFQENIKVYANYWTPSQILEN